MSSSRLVVGRRLGVQPRDVPGLVPGGFEPLPHAEDEKTEADTHVESFGEVPSDAGSTPAASTAPPRDDLLEAARSSRRCRLRPYAQTGGRFLNSRRVM